MKTNMYYLQPLFSKKYTEIISAKKTIVSDNTCLENVVCYFIGHFSFLLQKSEVYDTLIHSV